MSNGSAAYRALLDEAWETHVAKNAGYAGDSEDRWANFRGAEAFGLTALDGCLVRMSDKYIRIGNLRQNPGNDQVNESIRDTLTDLAAYALIAICLLDEEKVAERPVISDQPTLRCDHGVSLFNQCLTCGEPGSTVTKCDEGLTISRCTCAACGSEGRGWPW